MKISLIRNFVVVSTLVPTQAYDPALNSNSLAQRDVVNSSAVFDIASSQTLDIFTAAQQHLQHLASSQRPVDSSAFLPNHLSPARIFSAADAAMPSRDEITWHAGELALHKLLHAPTHHNPTSPGLPPPYAYRAMHSPIVAFGTLDAQGRPWTTVWGGERGFTRPVAQGILGVNTKVDAVNDPVFRALWGRAADGPVGEMVRPRNKDTAKKPAGQQDGFVDEAPSDSEGEVSQNEDDNEDDEDGSEEDSGKMMAALSIDLSTRDRVKFAGKMVVGAIVSRDDVSGEGELQLAMHVTESLGNCPKYLNKKDIVPHAPEPRLVSDTLPLPDEAVTLIGGADLFFLSSTGGGSMDTNHRGGPPGLVRVVSNSVEEGVVLVYPEFSGNRLYQTLGNLKVRPLIGMVIPQFETGDVLYLTGKTDILVGEEAAALLPRTKLAVKITVTDALYVKSGLPFRGTVVDYSPYNPPVRRLATEQDHALLGNDASSTTATFLKREALTPTISRFTFRLEGRQPLRPWTPGQHVTFDFGPELDIGWSHMRDDDPQSLNDDYVRTFTVSSLPPATGGEGASGNGFLPRGTELQITVRKHGPATNFLWTHNPRVPLDLPVMGFGGEAKFHIPTSNTGAESIFVAAGVGITPLLAQAPAVLAGGGPLRLLWTLKAMDLALAVDSLERIAGLGAITTLFVTGIVRREGEKAIHKIEALGGTVVRRRIAEEDVVGPAGEVKSPRKFYLCTGPEMLGILKGWLANEDHVWEDFGY